MSALPPQTPPGTPPSTPPGASIAVPPTARGASLSHAGLGVWLIPVSLAVLVAAVMVFLSAPAGLALTLALAVWIYILRQPLRGLIMFCVLAPALPWMKLGSPLPLPETLLMLTWMGVGAQWLSGQLPVRAQGATERAMLRLALWSVVPFVAGEFVAEGAGISPLLGVLNWLRWLLNISPVFLLPLLVRDARQREQVVLSLLLGFAALLTIALGFFVVAHDARRLIPLLEALHYPHPEAIADIFSADPTRMGSPWVHPNSTGGALLLAVPMGLFYASIHRSWRRLLGAFVALGGMAGIVFCGSRGALVCLVLFVVWLARRRTRYAAAGLVLALALAASLLLVYAPAQKRFASLFSANDVSTGVRFDEYAHFPANALQHPLGLGFKVETPASSPEKGIYGISNLWLNYCLRLGLPGMVLFIAATLAWWKEVRIQGPFTHIAKDNAMRIATTGTILAALATGFIDHYFSFTQVLIALFWLIFALGLLEARGLPDHGMGPQPDIRP